MSEIMTVWLELANKMFKAQLADCTARSPAAPDRSDPWDGLACAHSRTGRDPVAGSADGFIGVEHIARSCHRVSAWPWARCIGSVARRRWPAAGPHNPPLGSGA